MTAVPRHPTGESSVLTTDLGYAIGRGDLIINRRLGYFKLKLSPDERIVLTTAVSAHPDSPRVLYRGIEGEYYKGDVAALDQVVKALNWFEKNEAEMGEDKIAYDARTAFNHAKWRVKEEIGE